MTNQNASGTVKTQTAAIVAVLCLVVGFLGGIVFSVYKSPTTPVAPQPQQQAQQPQDMSQQLAGQVLALEREVANNPDNVGAWTQLGHVYFDTNQYDKAIKAYTKSLELNPNDANVWTDLGVMYRRSKQPQKAVEAFSKAIAADPAHETSRFNKGIVLLYDLNDRAGAIEAWEGLVSINPNATAPNGQLIKDMIAQVKAEGKK